jgi:hypothetical protein
VKSPVVYNGNDSLHRQSVRACPFQSSQLREMQQDAMITALWEHDVAPSHITNANSCASHCQTKQHTSSFRIEQRMYIRNPRPSIAREVASVRIISAPRTAEMHTVLVSLFIRMVLATFCTKLKFQDIPEDRLKSLLDGENACKDCAGKTMARRSDLLVVHVLPCVLHPLRYL